MGLDILISNGTLPLEVSIQDPFTSFLAIIVIPLVSVLAIILIGVLTWKYSKKQYERTALTDIFHILHSKENKDAEDLLIMSKGNIEEGGSIPEYYRLAIRTIKRNYYRIGMMIDYGLVPAEPFYITYGHKLVQLYSVCQKEIEKHQNDKVSHFGAYFQNLAIDCLNFYHDISEFEPVKDLQGKEIPRGKFGSKISLPKRKWKLFR